MNAEWIARHKSENRQLHVNGQQLVKRCNLPRNNCIEESEMHEVLHGYKQYRKAGDKGSILKKRHRLEVNDGDKFHQSTPQNESVQS